VHRRYIVLTIVLIAFILPGAIWFGLRLKKIQSFEPVAKRLPVELEAARREGLPLAPGDMRPAQRIPQAQNAAPLYRQLDAALGARSRAVKDEESKVVVLARSHKASDKQQARAIITRRGKEISLAEQAAIRPYCRFDRPWELGPEVLLPEYASMREIARLLCARAILEGDSGNPRAAMQTISTGSKVGRHAGEDPIMIGLLVNIAIYAIMDSAFQDVILAHRNNPQIIALASRVASYPPLPDLEHSFGGEVVMCRVAVSMVRQNPTASERLLRLLGRRTGRTRAIMSDAWETRMLEYWRACFRGIRSNRGDPIGQANALRVLGEDLAPREKEPTYELAAILMPVFSQAALKLAAGQEQQRLRKTLIELVKFKQKTERWPDSLSQLPVPPETDIFTNKLPIYRKTLDGFILYSVAENFKDDGGQAKRDQKTGAFDLVIQYPRLTRGPER